MDSENMGIVDFVINEVAKLDTNGVVALLELWNCSEFKEFAVEKNVDGQLFLNLTINTLWLWDHKCNAYKLISVIEGLRKAPDKYLNDIQEARHIQIINDSKQPQSQGLSGIQRMKDKLNSIEEIMRNLVPEKSFLYRNKQQVTINSYTPMSASPKKTRKFCRFNSLEYPLFNIKTKLSDRGYYLIKNNKCESKPQHTSSSVVDVQNEPSDEHLYEDLCLDEDMSTYKNIEGSNQNSLSPQRISRLSVNKIHELMHSFRLPFIKRIEVKADSVKDEKCDLSEPVDIEKKPDELTAHLYENHDSSDIMYDNINPTPIQENSSSLKNIEVEDYLVPRATEAVYSDVTNRPESLLGYILNLLESFGRKRDSSDTQSEDYQPDKREDSEIRKWNDERKLRGGNMADRPLPVPVENEPYYMLVDRFEAKNMLLGQPDGTFILRPSSQPNHVFTLSVSCRREVHNVGIRRRPDGRLALGYARRGERTFDSVTSLIKHHRKHRLLLVASGGILGATTLIGSPVYYQSPSSLPVNE